MASSTPTICKTKARKVFLSYHKPDEPYVQRVNYYLLKQPHLESYCYADKKQANGWEAQIARALKTSDVFVFFHGSKIGKTQAQEARRACQLERESKIDLIVVSLKKADSDLTEHPGLCGCDPIADYSNEQECARQIASMLKLRWISDDDLPRGYPFGYEKTIIDEYVNGGGRLKGARIEEGCPEEWPGVTRDEAVHPNPVKQDLIGSYRGPRDQVVVDARSQFQLGGDRSEEVSLEAKPLTFPEAGPREMLRYPTKTKLTVGVLVSGGIAPGINAVIAGIVDRHELYKQEGAGGRNLQILGYRDGIAGLLRAGRNYIRLDGPLVREQANLGGAVVGTSRAPDLLSLAEPQKREKNLIQIVRKLDDDGVKILYMIGGDGSMRAAHAIWTVSKTLECELSVVAIPKTMDNDILWVWQSFGFLSAVEEAKGDILKLHTEAKANPRLGIIQLFGSDSGFVVSHAALASGLCDAALIPEVDFTIAKLSKYICEKLEERYEPGEDGQSPYGLILMAEAAIPLDVIEYLGKPHKKKIMQLSEEEEAAVHVFVNNGRRVQGQTPDALRKAGLKILSSILQEDIRKMVKKDEYWKGFRVFTNEPRHRLRAIPPSVSDVIFGHRLGALAVDNAMAGYTDFMISQWLTEYVLVPLKLVVLGRKRVPRNGIFWKSVLANTGQPADLGLNPKAPAKASAVKSRARRRRPRP